jgi:ABC-type multidrug transport system ATPase subunit
MPTAEFEVVVGALDLSDEYLATVVGWEAELPLDARIGSADVTLSMAQAQQLALARIVLADPHTLILDEATSELNPRAARDLESSLAGVLDGRTVIAISHRLHTARQADRIAVMEHGRITEVGSHDALIAAQAEHTPHCGNPGKVMTNGWTDVVAGRFSGAYLRTTRAVTRMRRPRGFLSPATGSS